MRFKKILCILLSALLLLAAFGACGRGETDPIDDEPFFTGRAVRTSLTAKISVPLGEHEFESFLNRGMIKVSRTDGDLTRYGVLNQEGGIVLEPIYAELSMEGDFFLTYGGEEEVYGVWNREGEVLYTSENSLSLSDVGGGAVFIRDGSYCYLYHEDGRDLLPGTSMDLNYSYCDSLVIASDGTGKSVCIFDVPTGSLVRRFRGSDTLTYGVQYVGGRDVLVWENAIVESTDDYTFVLKREDRNEYVRQTVTVYTIGTDRKRVLTPKNPIVSVTDRYTIGVGQESRENYSLREGYYAVRYYRLDGNVADGSLLAYVGDRSLREVAALPEGVSPLDVSVIGGKILMRTATGGICLLNEDLEVLVKIEDAQYQNVVFSGQVVTASKVLENTRYRGVFDVQGNAVVPFEYNYISEFFGGKAFALKGNQAYIVDKTGEITPIVTIEEGDIPFRWEGFYEQTEGGKVGLISFDGTQLLPARYLSIKATQRFGIEVFVALRTETGTEVYRLF